MNVMMITGAGISTGSGLSTYRGADGRYTEIEKQIGMPVDKLLTPKTLASDPALVWKYWLEFSLALQQAQPSTAHHNIKAIADLATEFLEVTQNVDGLSALAGLSPEQLVELHGTYRRHVCTFCGGEHQLALSEDMAIPPRCFRCRPKDFTDFFSGAVIRPAVVMFDEIISEKNYLRAMTFARAKADLLVVSGTTIMFPYLGEMMAMASASGAKVLYVDPAATPDVPIYYIFRENLREKVICIQRTADEVFPSLAEFIEREKSHQKEGERFRLCPERLQSWAESL